MIRKYFLLVSLSFIILIFGSCSAFVSRNQIAAPKSISHEIGLESDPDLIHGTLDNGFRYYLYKNSQPENRVDMHLDILAGSINEKNNQRGLAHYLEHMLFNGSTHFKPGQLVEYFQSIGMDFGADANAHTGFFETVYDLSLPKGDEKSLEKALIVIDDYAQGALLLDSEIDRERGIILAEKRDRDSASFRTFKASINFELPGSRIVERFPIGDTKSINEADKKTLKDYYNTWYCPDNMILLIVGDFNIAVAEKLIKERFESLKPKGSKRVIPENNWKRHNGVKAFYHYEPEAGNTDITIETISRVDFKTQTLDDLKNQIQKNIGFSILNNRLLRLLGEKDLSFSEIGANFGEYLKNIAFSSIYAKTTPDKWENTLSILENNLRSALIFGFTEKELQRAKAEYINTLENLVKKSSTRESDAIALSILYHLNNKKIFQKPEARLKILKPYIQSLKVDDINKNFSTSWNEDHRLVLVTGNSKIGQNKEDAERIILSEYNKSFKNKINEYKDYNKVKFPYLPEPDEFMKSKNQEIIKSKNEIPDLLITTIDYNNHVRLNLKKTDFKKGEFIFNVAIKGGRITEPSTKPGIGLISENLLNESGLGKINKEELKETLAGTSVDIEFNIEGDSFSFSGQGEPAELKLVFELIYSFIKDPGFREESLTLVKKRYEQDFNSLSRTPEGLMQIKGNRFLAGGDARFGYPDIELINKISVQDVKAWLIPFFEKANLEISIVGDFNLVEAEELTTRYFGTLPERNGKNSGSLSNNILNFPKNKKLVLGMDTKIKKAEIRLTFLTDDFWDISQTRALNLLARVYSERYRKIIREKFGLAYSTYAYNNPSTVYNNYGVLHAVVLANPNETDLVLTNMKEIAVLLANKGVTEKELELVRKPVLNYIKDLKKTNAYWLDSVLSGSFEHPEKFEWARNIFNDYSSISNKAISLLAKKYIGIEDSAVIIIKPDQ